MSADDLEEESHSELPPSSSDKWMECPAWFRLTRGLPNPSSAAADEGTHAHMLLSRHLKGESELRVNPDNDTYQNLMPIVEWVYEQADRPKAIVHSEVKVDYGDKHGYVGLTGTADVVIVDPEWLMVADLKYGRGLVEVGNNTQLMIYLVGAVEKFGPRPVYRLAILQPRGDHFEGPIRMVDVTPDELAAFDLKLQEAVRKSYQRDYPAVLGPHCRKFCLALAVCPAVAELSIQLFRDNPVDEE